MSTIDTDLVPPQTVVSAKGDGSAIDVSGTASRVFLVTLAITKIIEQESLDVSIFGSPDGATWGAKSIAAFPQKFYCGESPLLLDLTAHADVKFVRAALGSRALGPRHRDAHVRVRRDDERSTRQHSQRGHSRSQSPGLARVAADAFVRPCLCPISRVLCEKWGSGSKTDPLILISRMKNESQVIVRPARNVRGSCAAARRQIHFSSLRHAGRHRRRTLAPGELFDRRRLRQHARLHALSGSGVGTQRRQQSSKCRDAARRSLRRPSRSIAATPVRRCAC